MATASSKCGVKETGPTHSPHGMAGARFELLQLHGRGGVGEVYRARDHELRRQIAVKQIQAERADDGESRARFELEAEITGRLEHPGVVPVYGFGHWPDGRPYIAMRFIEGQDLGKSIELYHLGLDIDHPVPSPGSAPGATSGTPGGAVSTRTSSLLDGETVSPGCDPSTVDSPASELPPTITRGAGATSSPTHPVQGRSRCAFDDLGGRKLLARFIHVCQVVAFAHSRGIIHRDIKPANVMLGAFGETLLVDWGLARPLDRDDRASPVEHGCPASDAPAGSMLTRAGGVFGTPHYMSPEQARGDHPAVGPASDLYSLGALLYAILTGRPPHQGKDVTEVLEGAREGRWPRPREIAPAVCPALEAVCLKALSRDPTDRYASALELAEEVERWLGDRPVRAYPEPYGRRIWRWVRTHRTEVGAFLVVMMVTSIVFLVACLLLARSEAAERRARELAEKREKEALTSSLVATRERDRTATQRTLTEQTLRAVAHVAGAARQSPALVRLASDPELRPLAADLMERFLHINRIARERAPEDAELVLEEIAMLELLARIREESGEIEAALRARSSIAVAIEMLGAVDPGAKALVRARQSREAIVPSGPPPVSRMESIREHQARARSAKAAGDVSQATAELEQALQEAQALASEFPEMEHVLERLADVSIDAGLYWLDLGDHSRARSYLQRALELLDRAPTGDGDVVTLVSRAVTCELVARTLKEQERFAEALPWFDQALARTQVALAEAPDAPLARQLLGTCRVGRAAALHRLGRDLEALHDLDLALPSMPPEVIPRLVSLRALSAVRTGDPERAAREADAMHEQTTDPDLAYLVALVSSAASEVLQRPDGAYHDGSGARLRADKAMQLLHQLASAGYFEDPLNRKHLESSPDAVAIRSRSDFRELLERAKPASRD